MNDSSSERPTRAAIRRAQVAVFNAISSCDHPDFETLEAAIRASERARIVRWLRGAFLTGLRLVERHVPGDWYDKGAQNAIEQAADDIENGAGT